MFDNILKHADLPAGAGMSANLDLFRARRAGA